MSSTFARGFAYCALTLLAASSGCARAELPADLSSCSDTELRCAGRCVDPDSDQGNCGACGLRCATEQSCIAGRCVSSCGQGLTLCGSACVDLRTNPANCGTCGLACAAGTACLGGFCQAEGGCFPPATPCGGECVSTNSDPRHCGGCFQTCPEGASCSRGRCDESCVPGLTFCSGTCVDLAFDPVNCGGCNVSCAPNETCTGGRCETRGCEPGLTACGGSCVDLAWDSDHCGACFVRCETGASCASGSCLCSELQTSCGDECVFTMANPEHCGGCFQACGEDETCEQGACVAVCSEPRIRCGDDCVNVNTHPNHCGACDNPCEAGQRCVQGECRQNCDWDLDWFPIDLDINAVAVGDLTLDFECNLYVGKQPGTVFRVDVQTREVETLATIETYVRGIVFRPEDGLLYFSSQDRVHRMARDGSDLVELENTNIGQHLNGMTMAPPEWGAFGGDLILARSDGLVIAIDPDDPLPTVIAELTPFISDVEFDGSTLYVAAYSEQRIMTVEPDGQVTAFVDAPCAPDGLSVAPGSDLFIACGDDNELYRYSFSAMAWTLLSEASLNGQFAPSGLLWDGTDTLIVLEQVSEPTGAVLKGYEPP